MDWIQVVWDILEFLMIIGYSIYSSFESLYRFYIPREKKSLKNEVILVTGSGRGIGREMSLRFAKLGAKVICWSRTAGPNETLAEEIKSGGGTAYPFTVDVSDRQKVREAASKVRKEVGDVTMIVNNAGILEVKPFLETGDSELESIYRVNVFSNFWVLKEFLPGMLERGKGHVVSICSASGLLPVGYIVGYSSSKFAVHGVMESLKDELRHSPNGQDIKFTTAYPFFTHTDMIAGVETNSRFPFLIPEIEVDDVADTIVDGIQREREYIYIPGFLKYLAILNWFVTKKCANAFEDFLQIYIRPPSKPQ